MPVRSADADDVDAIIDIDPLAASGDQHRLSYLRRRVERGECLVWVDDGAIVGYIVARPRHFFGRGFIDLLLVAPGYRRRGIARSLMTAALRQLAGTSDFDRVFTSTNRSNGPMQQLLAADGWQCSGELDGLDPGDPELVYFVDQVPVSRAAISSKTRREPW
jgi:ribosomal protein S18 acetylase RimI-like enzyme